MYFRITQVPGERPKQPEQQGRDLVASFTLYFCVLNDFPVGEEHGPLISSSSQEVERGTGNIDSVFQILPPRSVNMAAREGSRF